MDNKLLPNHRNNSFDIVRFAAAAAVLVSHHAPLSGRPEPFIPFMHDTLGGVAVSVFFVMSGYLMAQSLHRDTNLIRFTVARGLRVLPLFVIALIFTSGIMLIAFRNYDHFAAHIGYVKTNFMMFFTGGVQYGVPGILEGRPNTSLNGSLWTLPYEIWMYLTVYVLFILDGKYIKYGLAALLIMFAWAYRTPPGSDATIILGVHFDTYFLGKLGFAFFSGTLIGMYQNRLKHFSFLAIISALVLGALHIFSVLDFSYLRIFLLAIVVIAICNMRTFSFFGRFGDPSYGIYVFAFPIQQLMILWVPGFYRSMLVSFLATTLLAYITWHLLEKPAMTKRKQVSQGIFAFMRPPSRAGQALGGQD
ncbi:acyltransferase family protein [Achromobacter aegrifaciens]